MNFNNPHNLGRLPAQGRILNPQAQSPDEFFSGPSMSVSGWAPLVMANGNIRIAFSEQVFGDGKHHFRTAVEMPKEIFDKFAESLVEFQRARANAIKPEVQNVESKS